MSLVLLASAFLAGANSYAEVTHEYLFIGHPRDDQPGEIVQRDVERIDFSAYDLLLLGGDYTWRGTGTRETVAYLDAVFDLAAPTTLAALGNHDTSNKSYFTDVTGRPPFYAHKANGITFVVLDTTDDGQDIEGAELQMLENAIDDLSDSTHLVIVHHHILWLADYEPLAHLRANPLVGASSGNLSDLNFFDVVYPLLLQAQEKGVKVLCLAGDRTGTDTEEFFIDHTTEDGIRLVAAGFKEELSPSLRTAVVLEHDTDARSLDCVFKHLTDLPRIPDEPLVISELHYAPSPEQGEDHAFIELHNRGTEPYDLSGAAFDFGISYTFPADTVISPGEYVLLASDQSPYANLSVRVFNYDGDALPESGDPISLRDRRGLEIDFVDYRQSASWPSLADRQGHSIMLIHSDLDNRSPTSWAPSDQFGGSPGQVNIVAPSPRIVFATGEVGIQWPRAVVGAWYRIEYSATLSPSDWQSTAPATQASATTIEFTHEYTVDSSQRFFRLNRSFP